MTDQTRTTILRRSDWPRIRADLEQKLATTIRQFITDGSFASDAMRTFAKKVSNVERALARLDAVENKSRVLWIDPVPGTRASVKPTSVRRI